VRAVAIAGVGFFLDSYDIFAINLVTTFLGIVFWSGQPGQALYGFGGNNGRLPSPVDQALKASTSAGIVVGQVVFGCKSHSDLGRHVIDRSTQGSPMSLVDGECTALSWESFCYPP
jgi:hypothetical protein